MKVIFIVGPQGSGKTTLARLIAASTDRVHCSMHFDSRGQLTFGSDEKFDHDIIIDECPEDICLNSFIKSLPSTNYHKLILCCQKLLVAFAPLYYETRPIIINLTKPASAEQYRGMFNCDISQMVGVKAELIDPTFSHVKNPLEDKMPSSCFTKKKEYSKGYEILSSLDCISSSALDSLRIGISCLSFISAINMGNGPLDKSILILQDVLKSISDAKNSLNPDSNEQPEKYV